jgi:hypothetical protein
LMHSKPRQWSTFGAASRQPAWAASIHSIDVSNSGAATRCWRVPAQPWPPPCLPRSPAACRSRDQSPCGPGGCEPIVKSIALGDVLK